MHDHQEAEQGSAEDRFDEIMADYWLSIGECIDHTRSKYLQQNPDFKEELEAMFNLCDLPAPLLNLGATDAPQTGCDGSQYLGNTSSERFLERGTIIIPSANASLSRGFEIADRIGRGGSADVYHAKVLGIPGEPNIALKLLRRGTRLDVSETLRDVQVLNNLFHPNLVRVFAAGETEKHGPFLASELVPGTDLATWLITHGPLDARSAAMVVRTLAIALYEAHKHGIVHCDLNPNNIFGCLENPGLAHETLKLGDFGLARYVHERGIPLTFWESPTTGGTPPYMAPEQYWGEFSEKSDIYALGMLFLCLIKTRADGGGSQKAGFLGKDQVESLRRLTESPESALAEPKLKELVSERFQETGMLGLSSLIETNSREDQASFARLRDIIGRCLEYDSENRYETVADLADDLGCWLNHRQVDEPRRPYGLEERFRMLVARCRDGKDMQDHTTMLGLACIINGIGAVFFSTLGTAMILAGFHKQASFFGTSFVYMLLSLVVWRIAWNLSGHSEQIKWFLKMSAVLIIGILIIKGVLIPDFDLNNPLDDTVEYLIFGLFFSTVGMSNPDYWGTFSRLGLLVMFGTLPVALVTRLPGYPPFGPMLEGYTIGFILIMFAVDYFRRSNLPAKNRG